MGRTVIVYAIYLSGDDGGANNSFLMRRYSTPLSAAQSAANRLIGGPPPGAIVEAENNAAQLGTTTLSQLSWRGTNLVVQEILGGIPLILEMGEAVLFVRNTVNEQAAGQFHWTEVDQPKRRPR